MSLNMANVVDTMCPDGDLAIALADGVKLRASSRILGFASAVFDRIVKPHLRKRPRPSKDRPAQINDLHYEDSKAVTFLVGALHGVFTESTEPVPVKLFEQVAVLIEKYECIRSMKMLTSAWLATYRKRLESHRGCDKPGYLHDLVAIAYLLDDAEEFYKATQANTFYHRGAFCDLTGFPLEVPAIVYTTMAERKRLIHEQLSYDLNDAMSRFMGDLDRLSNDCTQRVPNGASCSLSYLVANSRNFFPCPRHSYVIDGKIHSLQDKNFTRLNNMGFLRHLICKNCLSKAVDRSLHEALLEDMHEAGKKAWESFVGVCIDCVKNGGASSSSCRVAHDRDSMAIGLPQKCPHSHRLPPWADEYRALNDQDQHQIPTVGGIQNSRGGDENIS